MRAVLAVAVLVAILLPAQVGAAECEFKLGFKLLRDQIPGEVGACLENERFNVSNGNAEQRTAAHHGKGGLLVWRKADNWTAFTDGYWTWINGPHGVQRRLNTALFDWETQGGRASTLGATNATVVVALERIAEWPKGRQLVADADSIRVQVLAEPIASAPGTTTFGSFSPRTRVIRLNTDTWRGANEWAVAGVLVHELRHASDYARGHWPITTTDCYLSEIRAFLDERDWYVYARYYMANIYGPIVARLWALNAKLELLTLTASLGDPESFDFVARRFLDELLGPYGEQCAR